MIVVSKYQWQLVTSGKVPCLSYYSGSQEGRGDRLAVANCNYRSLSSDIHLEYG